MLLTRIIPILLIDNGDLVKTKAFKNPRYLGDPINAVSIFNEKEVDELVILDITATKEKRPPSFELIEDIASQAFMPLSYGGGITSIEDIHHLFRLGVDKIILNSINFKSLELLKEASKIYGSQSIVGAIDIKKSLLGRLNVSSYSEKLKVKISPLDWAIELQNAGAGELILNYVDRESSYIGYDVDSLQQIVSAVNVPVVANGGAGTVEHMLQAKSKAGVSALAAGSMFVYHGRHQAVLITYPDVNELENLFGE